MITIGIFDSGVGGLTVLRHIKEKLPQDSFIYFGDTARTPYGSKSKKTIIRYSIENSIFLLDQDIDMLVVACNTSCSNALDRLEKTFKIPVIGVIDPAVQAARAATKTGRIGVIGTRATIASGVYQRALEAKIPHAAVYAAACPLFVPIIEERFPNEKIIRLVIQEYLKPLKANRIDTLVLGCTHYPLLEELIRQEWNDEIAVINPAASVALEVCEQKKQLQGKKSKQKKELFFVSDDPEGFRIIGEHFFGMSLPTIKKASFDFLT
jgi:glutamate racemase